MAVYRLAPKKELTGKKRCLLDDTKICSECGECDRCDLVPDKICDNCGRCLDEADYNGIIIDEIKLDEN